MGDSDDDQIRPGEDETPPELAEQWFAANLRAVREKKGLSQTRLADEMSARGWPWRQQTVTRVESGQRTVRLGEAKTAAEILGVTLDRLMWSGPEMNAVALVDRAAGILRESWNEVADATARLKAARDGAKRTIEEFARSEYQRVHDARTELKRELESATLDAAVSEGVARWEEEVGVHDEAADADREPEVIAPPDNQDGVLWLT